MKLYQLIDLLKLMTDNELYKLDIRYNKTEIEIESINDFEKDDIYQFLKWYDVKTWYVYDIQKSVYYVSIDLIKK